MNETETEREKLLRKRIKETFWEAIKDLKKGMDYRIFFMILNELERIILYENFFSWEEKHNSSNVIYCIKKEFALHCTNQRS